jgi:ankyrin repeat protein
MRDLNSELIVAASSGDVQAARRAIDTGANVNCTSDLEPYECVTPLMFAVKFGHVDMARILVAARANINWKSKSIIPDEPSRETALHWAVREQSEQICKILIAGGADVNAESSGGAVLNYAIESNNAKIIRMLVEAGSVIDKPTGREKYLPIHLAAEQGSTTAIKILCAKGAKLVPHPISGETCLMLACRQSHPKATKLLLALGDKPDVRDNNGWTALMHAAWGGNEECVKLLLRKKVDLMARNREGKTAWNLAHQVQEHAAVYALEKAGGRAN